MCKRNWFYNFKDLFDQVVVEFRNYNKYGYGGSNKACSWDLKKNITYKTVFVAGFSQINNRGGILMYIVGNFF